MANVVDVKIKADTKGAEKSVAGFSGKLKSAMPAVSMVSGALAGGALLATKLGDEFTMASRTIASGTGASGGDLKDLEKSFHKVFKDVPNDAQEVASVMADLNTELGLTGPELETATIQALNLSNTLGGNMTQTLKGVSDGMVIFGEDAGSVTSVMDKFAVVSQASGVPMDKLAKSVREFAPVMKNAGFTLDETTALFGNMEANGIKVSRVMPALNASMRGLAEEGVTDLKGALMDQMETIKNAETDVEALALATDMFGAEGAQRMSVAVRNGTLDIEALTVAMDSSEGTINNIAKETESTADKMDKMKNSFKSNLAPVGEFAGAMGPMIVMLPAMISGISGMSAVMGTLNLSLGPVLIAIVAIAAAIALGIVIWKNWDTIVETFWNTVEKLKEVWDVVWNKIKSVFDTVMGALSAVFNSKLGWLLPGGALLKALFLIRDNWDTIWNGMKAVVVAIANPIIGIINSVIGAMNNLFGALKKVQFGWEEKKKMGITVLPAFQFAPFQNLPTIPTIATLAKGGIVTSPTLAMIGESGPEAVVPLGSSGMGGVNVTITGDVYGFDDFEDKVSEAVRDGTRRGGFQGILRTA